MMNRAEAKDEILAYFLSEYAGHTLVAHDNFDFDKPEDQQWVRLEIRDVYTRQATSAPNGARKFTRYGMIIFSVFVPIGEGTYNGNQLCEKVTDIFEGERVGEIVFYAGRFRQVGVNTGLKEEGVWYQYNGQIRYEFDQIK
jgi:hypothetical protein